MMSVLKSRIIPKGIGEEEWKNMPLMEKFKTSYSMDKYKFSTNRWISKASMSVFWYTLVTQLYCFIAHVIPEYFSTWDPMYRYYMKVLITFIMIEGGANWLCVHFFDTSHKKTRDNPTGSALQEVRNGLPENGVKQFEDRDSDRNGLVWGFCDVCDLPKPPRTHHCKICNVCILKRDHHCYFTDACVGFYNQRYFVILNFYVGIASFLGFIMNVLYLRMKFNEESNHSVWDYFLPITAYKYYEGVYPGQLPIMLSHLYIWPFSGIMAVGFFITQLIAIRQGKTTREIRFNEKIKCSRNSEQNFRSVFGTFWWFNFLIPAVLIFRQEEDGKHWKNVKFG